VVDCAIIDVDEHVFEHRRTWLDSIDPSWRDDALRIEDDERGWPWLTWRGSHLYPVEIQHPGRPDEVGERRCRMAAGGDAPGRYEDLLPRAYGSPAGRLEMLDRSGLAGAVLFPNFGLVWEQALASDRPARRANMAAYNRWVAGVQADGAGRLFAVAHLSLDDPEWAAREIAALGASGMRLAMIAPAPVDGLPLSDRSFDGVWAAFVDAGVSPVFHVSSFPSPLDPAWHRGDPEPLDHLLDSVFLSLAPAVAIASMILHGTFERFPTLRLGVVELTAGWVPSFLLHLDGAFDFYIARHGEWYQSLSLRPSEYFLRNVRVGAPPYEAPARLVRQLGDHTFMYGSDWPHAEGVADPGGAGRKAVQGLDGDAAAGLLGANAAWLLGGGADRLLAGGDAGPSHGGAA
jgi:predicted TIM-barrel fold metal-dependent hydrolase